MVDFALNSAAWSIGVSRYTCFFYISDIRVNRVLSGLALPEGIMVDCGVRDHSFIPARVIVFITIAAVTYSLWHCRSLAF